MKTLKITVLALFMAATNLVCAQGMENKGKSAEERAEIETKELTEKLNLTSAQQKTVSDAALTRFKQDKADREKNKGDREAIKAARKQNNETFETTVKNVLTPDQKTKFEQLIKERKEKRANGGEKPAGE